MKREVTECDSCGTLDAKTVTISTADEMWDVDLCRECFAPMQALRPRHNSRFVKVTLPPQPQI